MVTHMLPSDMRVVLDTNVIYAALRSGTGASNALLRQIGTGKFEFYLSVALVLEYESVLKREGQASHYTLADVEALISYLCATGKAQTIHFLWRPQLRDPKDELVLELAANAGCQYIVTFNTRDFVGSEKFGVQTITPAQFLTLLGGQS